MRHPRLRAILCADWSKDARKRAVCLADVAQREIRQLTGTWTAASVVDAAREAAGDDGAALATFDAPIGVPASYWEQLRQLPGFPEQTPHFAAWLPETLTYPHFYENVRTPWDWKTERPFFAIAAGIGGRRAWEDKLRREGVETLRRVDELTGAKPVFVTSGIPGTAGSAARVLWQELAVLLAPPRHPEGAPEEQRPPEEPARAPFALWPFHGALDCLLAEHAVVAAEIYPRAAYALALSRGKGGTRAPLQIAKTQRHIREAAIADLQAQPWLEEHCVRLADLDQATGSEDAFDALLTAAGLLRCVLEGTPLVQDDLVDPVSEGGILGTGGLDLGLSEITYAPRVQKPARKPRRRRRGHAPAPYMAPRLAGGPPAPQPPPEPVFECPISGCDHVFTGSRAGWDAHVSSVRIHPKWHPDVRDPAERKALFRERFRTFFS